MFTKEEHDGHISQMIKNLTCDEAAFNIDNKPSFHSNHEVYGVLLEEYEEVEEAMEKLRDDLAKLWNQTRHDAPVEGMIERLRVLMLSGEDVIHEAIQVNAVAQKAVEQLEAAKRKSLDVAEYRLQKAINEYEKAPITVQSK